MAGTKIRSETVTGGRKMSDAARAKLSATNKARYAALPEADKVARLARIGRAPRAAGAGGTTTAPPVGGPPPPPPAPGGGSSNPLHDAPGDRSGPRPPRQGPVGGAPPVFRVPDLPPLELGGEPLGSPAGMDEAAIGGIPFGVSEAEVADLIELPFALISIRRGKHWKLLPEERDMLAGPLTRKINENALTARALQVGGDWLVILGGFGFVLYSRLEADRERAARTTDGSPASGRAEPPGERDRVDPPGRHDLRVVGGRLNGFATGADGPAGAQAADAPDPGPPLVQNLTF